MKRISLIMLLVFPCSSFAAFDPLNNDQITVVNADTITTPVTTPGPLPTRTPTPTPTPVAGVTESSGEVIIATVVPEEIDLTESDTNPTDPFAIVTPPETTTRVIVEGTTVDVQPDTVFIIQPPTTTTSSETRLIRGVVEVQLPAICTSNNVLHTMLADITSFCSNTRAAGNNEYTATYSQDLLSGTLTVHATSGSVEVSERSGSSRTLTAGTTNDTAVITANVPRVTWVLPIDNDKVYGGKQNQLVWTAYSGASGYILEYTLLQPPFSTENPPAVEFETQSIKLLPAQYQTYNDMITYILSLNNKPSSSGSDVYVEARLFAINADGEIISGSIASDRIKIVWE